MDKNGVIGKDNTLPWHLPKDLSHFKETTCGGTIIMGRNTYESLPRMLPNRLHVVVSSSIPWAFKSIEGAINFSSKRERDIFIIGGAEIYKQTMSLADRMYITRIDHEFEGDTFFPSIDYNEWIIDDEKTRKETDGEYTLVFETYNRV
jgi:dihydrofolate reductase